MKIKELNSVWHNGDNYALLNLPFVCYFVQPHWRYQTKGNRIKTSISFKSFLMFTGINEEEFESMEEVKKACETHLKQFLEYLFTKLEPVVSF
jgi:hypothetical protein